MRRTTAVETINRRAAGEVVLEIERGAGLGTGKVKRIKRRKSIRRGGPTPDLDPGPVAPDLGPRVRREKIEKEVER